MPEPVMAGDLQIEQLGDGRPGDAAAEAAAGDIGIVDAGRQAQRIGGRNIHAVIEGPVEAERFDMQRLGAVRSSAPTPPCR